MVVVCDPSGYPNPRGFALIIRLRRLAKVLIGQKSGWQIVTSSVGQLHICKLLRHAGHVFCVFRDVSDLLHSLGQRALQVAAHLAQLLVLRLEFRHGDSLFRDYGAVD